MNILGIDPGQSGGFGYFVEGDPASPFVWKMPPTDRDVWDLLNNIMPDFAYLEHVASRPKQSAPAMFKFATHYGMLRAFLTARGIPYETVTPGKWQRAMSCLSGGDKKVTYRRAQELFPQFKITHAIADALLIADYGRRVRNG